MNRRPIAVLGIAIAIASSAAFAQNREPPGFSPTEPKNLESSQPTVDNNASEEDAQLLRREPQQRAPGVSTYEAPSTTAPIYAAPDEPYVTQEGARVRVAPPPPASGQATIDHGLFNRTGVNDFGA